MPTDRSQYLKQYRQTYKARHKRVTVVFTAEEYRKIELDALAAKAKTASLIRTRSLEGISGMAAEPGAEPTAKEEIKELRFLLRNIANNINQMAYHSNRLRAVLDENEPLLALSRLEEELSAFVKRRGP